MIFSKIKEKRIHVFFENETFAIFDGTLYGFGRRFERESSIHLNTQPENQILSLFNRYGKYNVYVHIQKRGNDTFYGNV